MCHVDFFFRRAFHTSYCMTECYCMTAFNCSHFRLCLSCREQPGPRSCPFFSLPISRYWLMWQYEGYSCQPNSGLTWRVIPPVELLMCSAQLNFSLCPWCCKQGHSLINILHIKFKLGVGISLFHGKPIDKIRCFVLCSSFKEHNYNQRQKVTWRQHFGFNNFLSKVKQPASKSTKLCKTEGTPLLLEESLSNKTLLF